VRLIVCSNCHTPFRGTTQKRCRACAREGKRILYLALRGEFFDAIKRGEKTHEFRRANKYWRRRLMGQNYDAVELTRGYPKAGDSARRILVPFFKWKLRRIQHDHFGADRVLVFAIAVVQ